MCFLHERSRAAWAILSISLILVAPSGRAEEPLPDVKRLETSPVLRHLKRNSIQRPPQTPAEQTVAQMYLPDGFRAELVVAEPDLHQPVAFAFDERGRIWVAEAYSYPTKRPAGEGRDKIVIFADSDGDGRFESRKVFAENLNLVSGLEVGYGGVWVGAAPELLFIPDRDRDDVPDGVPQVLLDGFGYQDTHECLNSFLWGPDGWLYGNQGVFNTAHIGKPGAPESDRIELRAGVWRYHPVRHVFEVFAYGGSNQWGLDYDERGQIFMTHCRSYWGRGGTTHVIQGGHFWNQANANYAPFIISNPPEEFPEFRNYLLASARYDHGAGGAGKPGSDAIYGGHSHVGTMIYLGDNWPDEFRGHLFTHNLHGHQINQQINKRLGSGFDTVHAGQDQFFCSDPKYVAVDLQYGPDGAVYVIDWYDQQHCHNPNTERWDRGNGRIYRLQFDRTYKPVEVDLGRLQDLELVKLQTHKNDWYARTARRLLHERSLTRQIDTAAHTALEAMADFPENAATRLRAIWALHLIGRFSEERAKAILQTASVPTTPAARDRNSKAGDEYHRAWAIQLLAESGKDLSPEFQRVFTELARREESAVVRLYLASAMQRLPDEAAWQLAEALSQRAEDGQDRNLPWLLWQGIAPRLPKQLDRAFRLAEQTKIPQLADYIHWYAATVDDAGLDRVIASLDQAGSNTQRRRLAGLELAMNARGSPAKPAAWARVASKLYSHEDVRVRRSAERLAAAFGDDSAFPRLRQALADRRAESSLRKHAFSVLSRAQDRSSLSVFLELLDDAAFRSAAIPLLARFDAPEIPGALLKRFDTLSVQDRAAALNVLTSRVPFASALLDAIAAGTLKRDQLTAFHIRQVTQLRDAELDQRVAKTWGKIHQTPAEKQTQIARLEKIFNEAPLWAYDGRAGRQHFQKLCAQCHVLGSQGTRVGPELTGAGRNGIRYYLENIIDPNAVVGTDFQMTTIDTKNGDVVSGLAVNETPSAMTLRTTSGEITVPKAEIARRALSDMSLMPEGLLESLSEREQIELLKFLTSN